MTRKTIRVEMIGALVPKMDNERYFNFLKDIKTDIEGKISNMPEFKQKRKRIEVIFSLQKRKDELTKNGNIIEKVIEIDVSKITNGIEDTVKVRQILIDAAIEAVQNELSNIQASPEPIPEPEIKKGKQWWKI